ncbi:MAG TPA: hypothetical protein VME43_33475 [Bryobacteraceae bacterium]|nr:hypothetical protein [Bryobacteraceae bacterium]
MRFRLWLAILPALLAAAPAIEVVKPIISQSDGGPPDPGGFVHVAGETLFFTCRVANFTKSPEEKIHLAYSVQAFDPQGIPLSEIYKNEISDEVTPQDRDWQPKIETEIPTPPLGPSGAYKIVVKVEDLIAKTSTELSVPFQVRGHAVELSDTLVVRNFHYFRGEDDTQPLEKAAYHPGDAVWAKFDIVGYKLGEKNSIDVSYVTSLISPTGKVMWTQPDPAVDKDASFYPKRYVSASMGITVLKDTKPGVYMIGVQVKDGIGNQVAEGKFPFTLE